MDRRSILSRMEESGRRAPRVRLRGSGRILGEDADRYERREEIRRGETGVVFRSHDADLGREVALKRLQVRHLETPEVVRRFVEGARIAGQLQHPGVVPVYELSVDADRRPFFTMELLEGKTLEDLWAALPRTDRRLLTVFERLCQTIAYVHAQGVAHLDLTPDNVIVGPFGEVQVVGWGRAQALQQDSETHTDVQALGSIFCEILTGEPPPPDLAATRARLATCGATKDLVEICHASLHSPPPVGAAELATAVGSHLAAGEARAHGARIAAIEEREAGLRARSQAEEAVAATREHQRRQRQTWMLAAAILLAVLAGGVSWTLVQNGRRARIRRATSAVEAVLTEAARLQGREEWSDAIAAAERAVDLARSRSVRAGLQHDAAELLRVLQTSAAEARETARRLAEETAMVRRLEEIRLSSSDAARADSAYANAFAEFGIDLRRLERREAADRIRRSSRAADLVAALDHWALHDGRREELVAIARMADPDARRGEIRRAANDPEVLRALAARTDVTTAPAATSALLGMLLAHGGDAQAAADFLRKAQREHPADLWLHAELAQALMKLDPPRPSVAARHAMPVVALRPGSAFAWVRLGTVRKVAGDDEAAAAALRRALEIDPDCSAAAELLRNTGEKKEGAKSTAERTADED